MTKLARQTGLLLGMLGIAGTAMAQFGADEPKRDRRFYISPMATYSLFDGDRRFDDEVGYQLAIGKILGRGSNIEIHGSFVEPGPDGADGGNMGELTSYGISVLLFQARDSFPLYGILSVNKGIAKADGSTGDDPESDQFDVGLGYLLGLGRWPLVGKGPALRIEARYRTDKYSNSEAQRYADQFGAGSDRNYSDGIFAAGLFIPIGGDPNKAPPREEPEEPTTTIVIAATDSDGDQIPDEQDACPDTAPGAKIDVRGCERDDDNDGVLNSQDQCAASPRGQAVDATGCPPDSDGDGVIDATDRCPNSPAGSRVLADGCALQNDCRIPSAGERIDAQGCAVGALVLKGVNFESGSARLTSSAQQTLEDVAQVLQGAGQVRVEVGGHTDAQGDAGFNQQLSSQRASAVRDQLIRLGVSASSLQSKGYGESQPLASNETESGRAQNRRVELKLLN